MEDKTNSVKLTIKALKEVISSKKSAGIAYPIIRYALSFVTTYEILVMGKFLDSIGDFIKENTSFSMDTMLDSLAFDYFIVIVCLLFLNFVFSKISSYFDAVLYDAFWYSFMKKNIKKISQLNLEDVENNTLQNLITNVPTYSVDATWDTYKRTIDLGYNMIRLVSSGIIIAEQMSWWGVGVIILVIPEAFFSYRYNTKLKEYRDSKAEKNKYFNYLYNESNRLINFPELRVDNVFEFFLKSFERTAQPYYNGQNEIRLKRQTGSVFLGWFDGSLRRIVQLALIPFAVIRRYTIGTFKYLFDYIDTLYSASWSVIWNILCIKNNALYTKDYFGLLEYKGFGDIASGSAKLDPTKVPKIEFVNVEFKYPESSSAALDDISFEIQPGEKVNIIGRDNSGKSTLAKLLCGLYRVGPGDILIDDISIRNLDRGELKDKISVVFENYVKYNFSIRKNIVVTESERDFNRRRYEEALEITGLDNWLKEENISDSTVLGKLFSKGMDVSSGHWQRIAIARALYRDRAILILDESFTQIDGFSRKPIIEGIIKHRPKQTLINITQEETEKDLFDRSIYIDKGKIKKTD
ncbi:ABC transporter ATP-binding protein [Candidatus Dojkabacteria bacterium]|nr:ABC transporter ATP-binding protein [Candidatus Dojkabacteria bacterium]